MNAVNLLKGGRTDPYTNIYAGPSSWSRRRSYSGCACLASWYQDWFLVSSWKRSYSIVSQTIFRSPEQRRNLDICKEIQKQRWIPFLIFHRELPLVRYLYVINLFSCSYFLLSVIVIYHVCLCCLIHFFQSLYSLHIGCKLYITVYNTCKKTLLQYK